MKIKLKSEDLIRADEGNAIESSKDLKYTIASFYTFINGINISQIALYYH